MLYFNTLSSIKKSKARQPIGYKQAKSIGIIFNIEDINKHKAIKRFISMLEDDGKSVQVLSFLGKGRDNHEFLFEFITDEDITMWGSISNEVALKFIENKFDFLFHLDSKRLDIAENILSKCNARCRVGMPASESDHRINVEKFYEIIILPKKDVTIDYQLDEILHYIKKVTSDV